MKTKSRSQFYPFSPEKVFRTIDELGVTGMHMTKRSTMMMGTKLNLKFLTENKKGLGTSYRWEGRMMGIKIDFTVEVTQWLKNEEKTWQTVGPAKMILYPWFKMHLDLVEKDKGTLATLSISYEKPRGISNKLLSALLGDFYAEWCLKSMLSDTKDFLQKEARRAIAENAKTKLKKEKV